MKNLRKLRFGLIGHPLGHSLSPLIHELIMETVGIRGEYKLYDLQPEELPRELPKLLASLDGFNCTIPYKQAIISYLNGVEPSAQVYGAVNTVYKGRGYNTDGAGFVSCKVPMAKRSVLILGAGGVARVLAHEAARAGASKIFVQARNQGQAEELVREVKSEGFLHITCGKTTQNGYYDVILNGTPVGMWPDAGGFPLDLDQLSQAEAVFDTIYNPTATRLILRAKSKGIWSMGGLKMLFNQALAAQQIWHPKLDFSLYAAEWSQIQKNLAKEVLKQNPLKLVLTGFMGSGKTTIGNLLARRLKGLLPFVDLDEVIVERAGMSIAEIFKTRGESSFRNLERECLHELLTRPGPLILATGGGTLTQAGAADLINGLGALVIYLDIPLSTALKRIGSDPTRPMLAEGEEATKVLYKSRRPLYEQAADLTVPAEADLMEITKLIMDAFGWEVE